jgi:cytochrome c
MKALFLIVLTATLSVSATVFATEDGEALFKNSGCNACHTLSKTSVGPSILDIAAKYKDDNESRIKLVKKVRSGGAGSFGSMPMPPASTSVSNKSIKAIVAWVLRQK